jgi:hypothetical protein
MSCLGPGVLSHALVNNNRAPASQIKPEWRVDPVTDEDLGGLDSELIVISRDVVNDNNALRHDPDKLASVLLEIARRPRVEQRAPASKLELVGAH